MNRGPQGITRDKFLVTVQAWVEVEHATEAEYLASQVAISIEEIEDAEPSIQTCVVHKAPFRPVGDFWQGASVNADVLAADNER